MDAFVPGKTFLTGEYSVLMEGACLGIATRPCFKMLNDQTMTELHPESPAGQYLRRQGLPHRLTGRLHDPYQQLGIEGGFGRSTAEFLMALSEVDRRKAFSEIRKIYLDLHQDRKIKPSGMDLAFQYFGHICLARSEINQYQALAWPFSDLDFFVVATGLKIKTHEHLAELNLERLKHLPSHSDQVIESFQNKDAKDFILSLKNWSEALAASALTHPYVLDLKQKLEKNPDILLVKPCGALGADVLIIFFEVEKRHLVQDAVKLAPLRIVARASDLSEGMGTYVE